MKVGYGRHEPAHSGAGYGAAPLADVLPHQVELSDPEAAHQVCQQNEIVEVLAEHYGGDSDVQPGSVRGPDAAHSSIEAAGRSYRVVALGGGAIQAHLKMQPLARQPRQARCQLLVYQGAIGEDDRGGPVVARHLSQQGWHVCAEERLAPGEVEGLGTQVAGLTQDVEEPI